MKTYPMAHSRPARPPRSTDCPRRTLLRGAAGLVLAWLSPIRAAAQDAPAPPPAAGDLLVRVGDTGLIPIAPDDVPFDGRGLMVWAIAPPGDVPKIGSINQIIVARVNPSSLGEATRALAADDLVAYSAICTHNGCEVDESLGDSQTIYCSCHQSTFDPRDSGAVIGGPAPRALPALPLRVTDGRLVVGGPFTSAPGYGPVR
jgi:rieske iron-sulfur protein